MLLVSFEMTNISSYPDKLFLDNISQSVIYLFTCPAIVNLSGCNLYQVIKNLIM